MVLDVTKGLCQSVVCYSVECRVSDYCDPCCDSETNQLGKRVVSREWLWWYTCVGHVSLTYLEFLGLWRFPVDTVAGLWHDFCKLDYFLRMDHSHTGTIAIKSNSDVKIWTNWAVSSWLRFSFGDIIFSSWNIRNSVKSNIFFSENTAYSKTL